MVLMVIFLAGAILHPLKAGPARKVDKTDYSQGGADISYLGLSVYGKPSEKTGKRVSEWNVSSGINPEELGEYAEGDILFPKKLTKNGLISETARWEGGIVPFVIQGQFSKKETDLIFKAMEMYKKHSCIRFVPKGDQHQDWIMITTEPTGCWSRIGRIGGAQKVNLQKPGCTTKIGTPLHEFLHVLGFAHEHTRWERDDFVDIVWNNVNSQNKNNFQKMDRNTVNGFGVGYDYNSVMHYSTLAFTNNNEPTIIPKNQGVTIGQREGFSIGDLEKLNRMYNCPTTNGPSGPGNGPFRPGHEYGPNGHPGSGEGPYGPGHGYPGPGGGPPGSEYVPGGGPYYPDYGPPGPGGGPPGGRPGPGGGPLGSLISNIFGWFDSDNEMYPNI